MCSFKLLLLFSGISFCIAESFYLLTDKPTVVFTDAAVFPFINVTATRYRRRSYQYYTNMHFQLAVPLDDNFTLEVVFYEKINNQFRRSFFEMHHKWCSFLFNEPIFGAAIRRQFKYDHCPVPKGEYHLYNMTAAVNYLPRLPFSKGRIDMILKTNNKEVFKGYCDMEIKKKKLNTL